MGLTRIFWRRPVPPPTTRLSHHSSIHHPTRSTDPSNPPTNPQLCSIPSAVEVGSRTDLAASQRSMAATGEPKAKAARTARGPATKAHVGTSIDCRRVKLAEISTADDSGWRPLNVAHLMPGSRDRTSIDDSPPAPRSHLAIGCVWVKLFPEQPTPELRSELRSDRRALRLRTRRVWSRSS